MTVTIFVVAALFTSLFVMSKPKDTDTGDEVKITEQVKVKEDKKEKDGKKSDGKKDERKSDSEKSVLKTDAKVEDKKSDTPASKPAPSKPAPSNPTPSESAHTHTWTRVYKDHPAQAEQGHYEIVGMVSTVKYFPVKKGDANAAYEAASDWIDDNMHLFDGVLSLQQSGNGYNATIRRAFENGL